MSVATRNILVIVVVIIVIIPVNKKKDCQKQAVAYLYDYSEMGQILILIYFNEKILQKKNSLK